MSYNRHDRWPQPNPQGSYIAEPTPPKKRRNLALTLIFGGMAVVVLVLCAVAMLAWTKPTKTNPITQPEPTISADQGAVKGPVKATSKPVVKRIIPQIGQGEFEVGPDVTAGKYRTAGAAEGVVSLCTYFVSKTGSTDYTDFGTVSNITEPAIVTLKTGQTFKSSGCQPWIKQGS